GQAPHALGPDPQLRLVMPRNAVAQELAFPRPRYCTLLLVDAQMQDLLEEDPDATHHPLACRAAAYINVAVVGIATEGQTPTLEFPIQARQQDVGQQRRE